MKKRSFFAPILLISLIYVLTAFGVLTKAFAVGGVWVFDHAETYIAPDDGLGYDSYTYTDDSCTYFYDLPFKDENYQPLSHVETQFNWTDPPTIIPFGQEDEYGLWLTVTFISHPGSKYYDNYTNDINVIQTVAPRKADIVAYKQSIGQSGESLIGITYELGGLYGVTDLLGYDSGEIKEHVALNSVSAKELSDRAEREDWHVYWEKSGNQKYELCIKVIVDNHYVRTFVYELDEQADIISAPAYSGEVSGDNGLSPIVIILLAVGGAVILIGGTVAILRTNQKKPHVPITGQATTPYKPEVTDWRGNRIDENAHVRQTHAEYTQANRSAQADYDAQRRAEETVLKRYTAEQDRMLDELIRVSQRLSTTTRNAAWKLNEITRKQIDSAISGNELDPTTVNRIMDGFGKFARGNIIGEDDVPPMPTNAQLAVRAYEDAFEEVCRNQTATAVAARTVSSVLSGGASDKLFQVGKGFYRMKDYIDAGGDNGMGAVSYALFGEARDRVVNNLSDKVMWKLPFTPKGSSLPKKIMYDQRKRYVKQAVNAADKSTIGSNDKAMRFIQWMFE